MYLVEADSAKRFIIISAAGQVTAAEVKQAAEDVRNMVKGAPPGFHVLTDFRFLELMEPASAKHVAEIMDAFVAGGVASVVRVVPDPRKDVGMNILSQFHYGTKIPVANFESLAEAINALIGETGPAAD